MKREIIRPEGAQVNPVLSPAARFGNLVFTQGMVGTDPATGKLVGDEGSVGLEGRHDLAV